MGFNPGFKGLKVIIKPGPLDTGKEIRCPFVRRPLRPIVCILVATQSNISRPISEESNIYSTTATLFLINSYSLHHITMTDSVLPSSNVTVSIKEMFTRLSTEKPIR